MGCNEENKRGQAPFLYFDYSGAEKSERWKKGACPLFYLSPFLLSPFLLFLGGCAIRYDIFFRTFERVAR